MSEYHKHSSPIVPEVYGRSLSFGIVIQEGDVYASTNGKWEKAPEACIGTTIHHGCKTYWVRPETPQ